MKIRIFQFWIFSLLSVFSLSAVDKMEVRINAESADPIEIRNFDVNVQLFTNRTNMPINDIPSGFEGFKFLSSGGGSDMTGTIQATESGKIYIAARASETFSGWDKVVGADFTYAATNTLMSVFYKEVNADEVVVIPVNTDFRRVTPLAKSIVLENAEEFVIDNMEVRFQTTDHYLKSTLEDGLIYFLNRNYTVYDVPDYLEGFEVMLSDAGVANDGQTHTGLIIPSRNGEIYVIGRSGIPVPGWSQVAASEFYYNAGASQGVLALFRKSVVAGENVVLPVVDNFQEVRPVAQSILVEFPQEIDEMEITFEVPEEDFTLFTQTDFIESARLFTNRVYEALNIPGEFEGFEIVTSEAGKEERGVMIPHADGYIYVIAKPGGIEGWEELTASQFFYSTATPTAIAIYRKKVTANERIELPRIDSFQGITPLAKKIHFSHLPSSSNDRLESLVIDGEIVPEFKTELTDYKVLLPHSYNVLPIVEPELQVVDANFVIQPAEDVRGTEEERTTTITVTSKDETESRVYRVLFEVLPPMDLYLCIGQSNMAGYAPMDSNLGDLDTMDNVFLLNSGNRFETAVNPLNRYSTVAAVGARALMGPAYSFSKAIETRSNNSIGLIVNARGGSSLENWMKGGDGGERDTLYNPTMTRALEAKKWGEFKGILWHQGEANKGDISQYPQKLEQFVLDLRTDLGEPELPFIAGQIGEFGNNVTAFNEMIATISTFIDHADCVSSVGLANIPGDSNHFGRDGIYELGERYAESIVTMNYPPDLMHVVVESDPGIYEKRALATNVNLFLNRPAYTVTNTRFSGFEGFEFLASNGGEEESGVMIPERDGKLYIIADKGQIIDGWTLMFDTEIYYPGAELGIYYRKAQQGERVPIPKTQNFKGITPLAHSVELVEILPEQDARVRTISIDGEVLKQFDKDLFAYEVFLPFSKQALPEITLTPYTAGATYQVQDAVNMESEIKEERTSTVFIESSDKSQQLTYLITFTKLPEMDLFLCIGQSNMAGAAPLDATQGDLLELDNAYLFNSDNAFEKAKNGMNRYANILTSTNQYYGLTYQFAKKITAETNKKIGLVVNARGGSSIDQWKKGSANPADSLYQKTLERAIEAGKWGSYKAILWHQGEADRSRVTAYPDKLADLVAALRSDLDDPNLLFVAGQLGEWNVANDDFNAMILDVNSFIGNAAAVSSEELINITNLADVNSHFNRNGLVTLGNRYADIVLDSVYTTTDIKSEKAPKGYVTVKNRWLTLHGFEESGVCMVYDVSGRLIMTEQLKADLRLYLDKPGVYLVRIVSELENQSLKVSL